MREQIKEELRLSVRNFHLPRYDELPDDGFYLEQAARYISECLSAVQDAAVTGSMISNYVKKGMIANPVRKQYLRDHLAYLIFIAAAKNALSMDEISMLVKLQKNSYGNRRAYDYFCCEFENVLGFVFGAKNAMDSIGGDETDERMLLRDAIITIAHKIYLNHCLQRLCQEEDK